MPFGSPQQYPGQFMRAVRPWIEPSIRNFTGPMRNLSLPLRERATMCPTVSSFIRSLSTRTLGA